jgi:hypothetical protein
LGLGEVLVGHLPGVLLGRSLGRVLADVGVGVGRPVFLVSLDLLIGFPLLFICDTKFLGLPIHRALPVPTPFSACCALGVS